MTIPNQKLREILFVALFARAQGMKDETATVAMLMEQLKVPKQRVICALEKTRHIETKSPILDEKIQSFVISYDYDRIQTVEKTALRLGAYEILFEPELPPKVAISEALRLTKKFGSPAATAFVNGILDALFKKSQGLAIDEASLESSIKLIETVYKEESL